jgi:dolichyl-phosphate beta-glucosyltransferase
MQRSFIRNFLMHGFHLVVYLLSRPGVRLVKDTQCGFKLFTRSAAKLIFPNMHVEGWIFDIEILTIADYLGIQVAEVPVTWNEVEGSKMSLLRDSIKMALDMLVIRANYLFGTWTLDNHESGGLGVTAVKKTT